MGGRLVCVGGVGSSCMSYSDKADSDDHTMAATLVFLFAFRLRRRWTFLFLEFPGSRVTEEKTRMSTVWTEFQPSARSIFLTLTANYKIKQITAVLILLNFQYNSDMSALKISQYQYRFTLDDIYFHYLFCCVVC